MLFAGFSKLQLQVSAKYADAAAAAIVPGVLEDFASSHEVNMLLSYNPEITEARDV